LLTDGNSTVVEGGPGKIENHSTASPSRSTAMVQRAASVSPGQLISPCVPALTIIVRVPSTTTAMSVVVTPSTSWNP